jgi:hypothetical protein
VVATILLLALTVTLFASIFAFVTSFPAPPAQNSNQFQATLIYNSGATTIIGLNIVHLAGPQVSTSAQIYLKSAGHPCVSGCPFVGSVPVSLAISGLYWNLGQTWSGLFSNFPQSPGFAGDPVPDNITVSIVTDANLIFSVILPGQAISVPATITATWISPGSPTVGTAYEVFATVAGTLGTNPVYLAGVPGQVTSPQRMAYNAATGYWYYNILAGNTTAAGTVVGFVSATSANGASATAPVTVTITPSASGGGGPFSVAVVLSNTPPFAGAVETPQAIVSYTGTAGPATLTVTFTAMTSGGTTLWTGSGPSGQQITGPTTLTVLSQTTWTIPTGGGGYYVTAAVTAASPINLAASGSLYFTVAAPALTLSPTSGVNGVTVTASGTSFTPGATITFTSSNGGTIGSPSACTVSATGTFGGCTFTFSGSGTSRNHISYTITATGSDGGLDMATATFTNT